MQQTRASRRQKVERIRAKRKIRFSSCRSRPVYFSVLTSRGFCYFPRLMPSPEELAREKIDKLLVECGWTIQNRSTINLSVARGVAIREALLKDRDEVDYLLFVDGKAIGTVEAKPEGYTLTGVEEQSGKYGKGLLDIYPKWREPLPFAYESTGVETQFTNQLDPSPKSRNVFAFHRPETLLDYLQSEHQLNTRLAELLTTHQMPTTN